MIVATLVCLTLAAPAWAGCTADTTVNSFAVETTPTTDCLAISVEGNECVGDVSVRLINNCAGTFAPAEDEWVCVQMSSCDYADEDRTELVGIPAGNTAKFRIEDFVPETDETRSFSGTLDGQTVDLEVRFNASEELIESGCSQSGASLSRSWLAIPLGLLMLVASRRRRPGLSV